MRIQGKAIFHPEYIQPAWLSTPKLKWYYSVLSRYLLVASFTFLVLALTFIIGALGGVFQLLIINPSYIVITPVLLVVLIITAAIVLLPLSALFGAPLGLSIGVVEGHNHSRHNNWVVKFVESLPNADYVRILSIHVLLDLPFILLSALLIIVMQMHTGENIIIDWILSAMMYAWCGLDILNRKPLTSDWRKISKLVFSGSASISNAIGGFIVGSFRAILWLGLNSIFSLPLVLTWGIFGWIVGLVIGSVGSREIDALNTQNNTDQIKLPRKIHLFAGNAALAGLFVGSLIAIVYAILLSVVTIGNSEIDSTLSRMLFSAPNLDLYSLLGLDIPVIIFIETLTTGAMFGVGAALWLGGAEVVYYLALRIVLWLGGDAPFSYRRFLNHASNRMFIRSIGNSYEFIHSYLFEYFASLKQEQVLRNKSNK
jgi:hypothetical protein